MGALDGIITFEAAEYRPCLVNGVNESDRAARRYIGGNITYAMQGAIHTADVYCAVTL